MERSALFFDIDGTILSDITHQIPASTISALKKASENGHFLFINTGRTYPSLPKEILDLPFDGYLCGCGSYIVFRGEVLLESHLSEARGKAIIQKMYECCLDGILEGADDIYYPEKCSRFEALEYVRQSFTGYGVGTTQYIETGNFVYDKLFVYADEQSDTEGFFRFLTSEDMEIMGRGNGTYEVVQKKFSKATACEFMLERLGIDLEHAYVFGDSSNDMPMFLYAKHAVAMGTHSRELDPYTEFVTRKVEDDGVEYALKHYGLI